MDEWLQFRIGDLARAVPISDKQGCRGSGFICEPSNCPYRNWNHPKKVWGLPSQLLWVVSGSRYPWQVGFKETTPHNEGLHFGPRGLAIVFGHMQKFVPCAGNKEILRKIQMTTAA